MTGAPLIVDYADKMEGPKMRPYRGTIESMIGPGRFGYVDAENFLYGEKGGRFLYECSLVTQEPRTSNGTKRLPVWSEHGTDDIVVACPPNMVFNTVEEGENQGLIWVHQISRKSKHWRHDRHPMSREAYLEGYQKVFEGLKQIAADTAMGRRQILSIPILDEKDGKKKVWQVSSTSSTVQKLLELGKIGRTADNRYYLIDSSPVVLRKPENP
jgi:hypothetical protein